MRRLLPSFLLSLAAVGPFVIGCDKLKKDDPADAGLVIAALVDAGGIPAVPTTATTPAVTAAPPLGATTTTATAVTPTPTGTVTAAPKTTADAGKPADAGPATTPTIPPFPTALPSGFPTALPTTLPQIPLDGGAFKPPWQQ